jgi:hypothetical protein
MVVDDLVNIAKEGSEELKESVMAVALYMIRDGCALSGNIYSLIKFFLDEVRDEKLGTLLCELIELNDIDEQLTYDDIVELSKYAAIPDWGKHILMEMDFDQSCLEGYIEYAKALYKVGAEEESKCMLYDAVAAFDAPNISVGIRIMMEENFPADFINLYDSSDFDQERTCML